MEQKLYEENTTAGARGKTLRPVSNDPKDNGLYIVTTYDDFFRELPNERKESEEKKVVAKT